MDSILLWSVLACLEVPTRQQVVFSDVLDAAKQLDAGTRIEPVGECVAAGLSLANFVFRHFLTHQARPRVRSLGSRRDIFFKQHLVSRGFGCAAVA